MQFRSAGILVGGIVVGLALAGLTASAMSGYGPMAGWSHGTMGQGMMGNGMMGGGGMMGNGCHMCSGSSAGTSGTGTLVVMKDYQYQPTTLNARVGDTVTWRNDDSVAHTVTSDTGEELDSGLIQPGSTWTHQFTQAGTFSYHCAPHSSSSNGSYSGMTGRVVVS
ncbi:MAG: plastocyanin/azurin family copper-binding protein [Candidatus Thermoplasmatota archaeon]